RHVLLGMRSDEELGKLLAGVTIVHGGVLLNINHAPKQPKSPSKAGNSPKKAYEI
ncbi:histone H2A, partial [Trifolium pratense]